LDDEGTDIGFVNLLFPDILGELRGFEIPSYELATTFDEGKGFDGSSIEGLARIEESDLLAVPNPDTFRILPWDYENGGERYRVACLFCDICNTDGTPHEDDTRNVLKRSMAHMQEQGFSEFMVGPEMEFFYLDNSKQPAILDKGDYFSMGIGDPYDYLRKKTVLALLKMGIIAEYGHHEVAPSQHEIDLRYGDALAMADTVMLLRYIVKEFARREDIYATFMPKPLDGENGNGMHVHQSLWKDGNNVFYDGNERYCLSAVGQQYTGGIMQHVGEITAVLNQWVNSFKRLIPGFEAPVYVVWGQKNRSALVRIPEYKPGKAEAVRIELRSPDPGCNPYLAFAVMLAAGLRGIEGTYNLPEPCEADIYAMSDAERDEALITTLPANLEAAVSLAKNSQLVKETLGASLFRKFIMNKEIQIRNYRQEVGHKYDMAVGPFEIEHNLPRL
jgi:glutamine synthetase